MYQTMYQIGDRVELLLSFIATDSFPGKGYQGTITEIKKGYARSQLKYAVKWDKCSEYDPDISFYDEHLEFIQRANNRNAIQFLMKR